MVQVASKTVSVPIGSRWYDNHPDRFGRIIRVLGTRKVSGRSMVEVESEETGRVTAIALSRFQQGRFERA